MQVDCGLNWPRGSNHAPLGHRGQAKLPWVDGRPKLRPSLPLLSMLRRCASRPFISTPPMGRADPLFLFLRAARFFSPARIALISLSDSVHNFSIIWSKCVQEGVLPEGMKITRKSALFLPPNSPALEGYLTKHLTKEKQYARNNFAHRLDSDAGRCNTRLASQPKVGVLPQWRARSDPAHPAHPAAFRPNIRRRCTCLPTKKLHP